MGLKIKSKFIAWLIFFIFSRGVLESGEIKVAAAANVQNAISEIADIFTSKSGIRVLLIFASSGKLTTQIKNGAPFDIFISADNAYPLSLYSYGLALKPEVYAYGALVVWTTRSIEVSRGLAALAEPGIEKISIPNPELAPYGRAALQAIQKANLEKIIKPKLVYAESVTQSNQYIQTGSVEAGFTSLSSVLDPGIKNPGNFWIVDAAFYSVIEQSACVLEYGRKNHPEETQKFFRFLFSKEAEKIFMKYGYKRPRHE